LSSCEVNAYIDSIMFWLLAGKNRAEALKNKNVLGKIRLLRLSKGWTQERLAFEIARMLYPKRRTAFLKKKARGIQATASGWELGIQPTPKTRKPLALALGSSLEELGLHEESHRLRMFRQIYSRWLIDHVGEARLLSGMARVLGFSYGTVRDLNKRAGLPLMGIKLDDDFSNPLKEWFRRLFIVLDKPPSFFSNQTPYSRTGAAKVWKGINPPSFLLFLRLDRVFHAYTNSLDGREKEVFFHALGLSYTEFRSAALKRWPTLDLPPWDPQEVFHYSFLETLAEKSYRISSGARLTTEIQIFEEGGKIFVEITGDSLKAPRKADIKDYNAFKSLMQLVGVNVEFLSGGRESILSLSRKDMVEAGWRHANEARSALEHFLPGKLDLSVIQMQRYATVQVRMDGSDWVNFQLNSGLGQLLYPYGITLEIGRKIALSLRLSGTLKSTIYLGPGLTQSEVRDAIGYVSGKYTYTRQSGSPDQLEGARLAKSHGRGDEKFILRVLAELLRARRYSGVEYDGLELSFTVKIFEMQHLIRAGEPFSVEDILQKMLYDAKTRYEILTDWNREIGEHIVIQKLEAAAMSVSPKNAARLSAIEDPFIKSAHNKWSKRFNQKLKGLRKKVKQAFEGFDVANPTVRKIKRALRPHESNIKKIIFEIKKLQIEEALLLNSFRQYQAYFLEESGDCGVCFDVSQAAIDGMVDAGLDPKFASVKIEELVAHVYPIITTTNGIDIGVDFTAGQYFSGYANRVLVEGHRSYYPKVYQAVLDQLDRLTVLSLAGELESARGQFEEDRSRLMDKLNAAARLVKEEAEASILKMHPANKEAPKVLVRKYVDKSKERAHVRTLATIFFSVGEHRSQIQVWRLLGETAEEFLRAIQPRLIEKGAQRINLRRRPEHISKFSDYMRGIGLSGIKDMHGARLAISKPRRRLSTIVLTSIAAVVIGFIPYRFGGPTYRVMARVERNKQEPTLDTIRSEVSEAVQILKLNGYPDVAYVEDYLRFLGDDKNIGDTSSLWGFSKYMNVDGTIKLGINPAAAHEFFNMSKSIGKSNSFFIFGYVAGIVREAWGLKLAQRGDLPDDLYGRFRELRDKLKNTPVHMQEDFVLAHRENIEKLAIEFLSVEYFEVTTQLAFLVWAHEKGLFSLEELRRHIVMDAFAFKYREDPIGLVAMELQALLNNAEADFNKGTFTTVQQFWVFYHRYLIVLYEKSNGAEGISPEVSKKVVHGGGGSEGLRSHAKQIYPVLSKKVKGWKRTIMDSDKSKDTRPQLSPSSDATPSTAARPVRSGEKRKTTASDGARLGKQSTTIVEAAIAAANTTLSPAQIERFQKEALLRRNKLVLNILKTVMRYHAEALKKSKHEIHKLIFELIPRKVLEDLLVRTEEPFLRQFALVELHQETESIHENTLDDLNRIINEAADLLAKKPTQNDVEGIDKRIEQAIQKLQTSTEESKKSLEAIHRKVAEALEVAKTMVEIASKTYFSEKQVEWLQRNPYSVYKFLTNTPNVGLSDLKSSRDELLKIFKTILNGSGLLKSVQESREKRLSRHSMKSVASRTNQRIDGFEKLAVVTPDSVIGLLAEELFTGDHEEVSRKVSSILIKASQKAKKAKDEIDGVVGGATKQSKKTQASIRRITKAKLPNTLYRGLKNPEMSFYQRLRMVRVNMTKSLVDAKWSAARHAEPGTSLEVQRKAVEIAGDVRDKLDGRVDQLMQFTLKQFFNDDQKEMNRRIEQTLGAMVQAYTRGVKQIESLTSGARLLEDEIATVANTLPRNDTRGAQDDAELRRLVGEVKPSSGQRMAVSFDPNNPTILRFEKGKGDHEVKVYVGGEYFGTYDTKERVIQEEPGEVQLSILDLTQILRDFNESERYNVALTEGLAEEPLELYLHLDGYSHLTDDLQKDLLTIKLNLLLARNANYTVIHLIGDEALANLALRIVEGDSDLRDRMSLFTKATAAEDDEARQIHLLTKSDYLAHKAELTRLKDHRFITLDDLAMEDGKMDVIAFNPVFSLLEMVGVIDKLEVGNTQFDAAYRFFRDFTGFEDATPEEFIDYLLLTSQEVVERFAIPPAIRAIDINKAMRVIAMGARMAAQAA